MSIIGIDFGKKRVGIAIEIQNIAIPYKIIERFKIIDELKKIIKERNIEKIIIGDPLNLDGTLSEMSIIIRDFIKKLEIIFPNIQIILNDERLSSFEASFVNNEIGKKDDIAASIILNSYLSSNK